MPKPTLSDKLVVAISSRALFDLSASHLIFTEQGVDAYQRYQIEHEDEILAPGPAFTLVKKLLRLNRPDKQYVEVILLSRNSADTGLRVFNSIKHYSLDITRAAFTKGEPTSRYVPAFGAHLFLSADQGDVRRALDEGHAAAHERVIRTLRAWNIRIDEALFLGGLEEGEFLRAFRADIFFDDQRTHIDSALKHVAAGHVPHGVANEEKLSTN